MSDQFRSSGGPFLKFGPPEERANESSHSPVFNVPSHGTVVSSRGYGLPEIPTYACSRRSEPCAPRLNDPMPVELRLPSLGILASTIMGDERLGRKPR